MMEYRNAKHTAGAAIDAEILHPKLGWIPTTIEASDTGADYDAAELHAKITAAGGIAPYVAPPPPPIIVRKTPISDALNAIVKLIPTITPAKKLEIDAEIAKVKKYEQD